MRAEDYGKLLEDLEQELTAGARSIGIIGLTSVTLRLLASLAPAGVLADAAVYAPEAPAGQANPSLCVPLRPLKGLTQVDHDVLVVATDNEKEDLLLESLPFMQGTPRSSSPGTAISRSVTRSSTRSWPSSSCLASPMATRTAWCISTSAL